jgi:replicative DNA helicase
VFNVVLVFDGDKAGEMAIEKAIDDKFAKEKDFRVKLCQMPEGEDPDSLIRSKDMGEFVRLKRWTAFQWRMMKFMEECSDDDEDLAEEKKREIAEKMAPIIVSETSHIRQEEMAKQVAKMTGYDRSTILSEVKRLRSEKEADIQNKKRNAIEALLNDVRHNPDEAEMALVQAQSAINDINKSVQDENVGSSTLNVILSQKEEDEKKTGDFAGFHMKPYGLGGVAAQMDDDWRKDNLIFVGGSEQAGKTTFCTQMAYEIADDPRNDAMCIYHSIDDASRFPVYKWVCNATESTKLKLNHVSSPKYWANQEGHEYVPEMREQGYRKVMQMIKEERLVIKDASDGQSLTYAESLVKFYREKYPERNIVLFCDNFHKYPDYAEMSGHERIKRISNHLKNMTVANHITVVSTVEYRKLAPGEKPTNLAIAESRALAYDSTAIIHLHNDLHHTDEDSSVLVHEDDEGKIMPRIWVKFGKNKISGFEGRLFVDLFGYAGTCRAVDTEIALKEQGDRIAFLKNKDTGI